MILIINESRGVTTLLKAYLESSTTKVEVANTFVEAIQIIKKHDFKKIITDVSLPGTSGLELIASLQRSTKEAKVIVLSYMDQISYKESAKAFGIVDYHTFPIDMNVLEKLAE